MDSGFCSAKIDDFLFVRKSDPISKAVGYIDAHYSLKWCKSSLEMQVFHLCFGIVYESVWRSLRLLRSSPGPFEENPGGLGNNSAEIPLKMTQLNPCTDVAFLLKLQALIQRTPH